MHVPFVSSLWQRLDQWWHEHRPLEWVEVSFGDLREWKPDPNVMDRLVR